MIKDLKELKVDINRDNYTTCAFKQYDNNSRKLDIVLLSNNELITDYTNVKNICVNFKKSDGKVVFQRVEVPRENGVISIVLKAQVLACVGTVLAEVVISGNNDEILTSGTFTFEVTESFSVNAIESNDDWGDFQKVLDLIDKADDFNKAEQERVANEKNRVSAEQKRVANDIQIKKQWEEVKKATENSGIGGTIITEVISARTDKAGHTYSTLDERLDNMEFGNDGGLATKQNKYDNTLETSNKTIVGAINEVNNEVSKKVEKKEGKDLSTNDYTNEDKQKLRNTPKITISDTRPTSPQAGDIWI